VGGGAKGREDNKEAQTDLTQGRGKKKKKKKKREGEEIAEKSDALYSPYLPTTTMERKGKKEGRKEGAERRNLSEMGRFLALLT